MAVTANMDDDKLLIFAVLVRLIKRCKYFGTLRGVASENTIMNEVPSSVFATADADDVLMCYLSARIN